MRSIMSHVWSFWSTRLCRKRAREVDRTSRYAAHLAKRTSETPIRPARLVPMEIVRKIKKHPCLKIILCPMAFAELHKNCIALFKVYAGLAVLHHVSTHSNQSVWPRRGLPAQHRACTSRRVCVRTGESIVASPWPGPEHKKNTTEEESVKPVALTYLTAEKFFLSDFLPPPSCISPLWKPQHVPLLKRRNDQINPSP